MPGISEDPIINAVNEQIFKSIDVCIENKCFSATVILIFAGIDAMSNINRPEGSKINDPNDFKRWVEKYFHIFGETTITSAEWWAARNAIIHTFGVYSKSHYNNPNERIIGWMVGSNGQVIFSL